MYLTKRAVGFTMIIREAAALILRKRLLFMSTLFLLIS